MPKLHNDSAIAYFERIQLADSVEKLKIRLKFFEHRKLGLSDRSTIDDRISSNG
jgi:hypothetical protein